jgi:GNAT superfamily N-acetyltransferase
MDSADPPVGPDAGLTIVDLESGDTSTVRAVFDGLSADSRYRRFQSSRPVLSARTLRHLATVRPPDRVTHAALLDGRPVGLIHWIRLPGTRDAEVACEVVDAAQHRGIGKALFRRAAQSAADSGIESFVAHLYIGDPRLIRRAGELGSVPDRSEPGRYRMPVRLAAAVGSGQGRS